MREIVAERLLEFAAKSIKLAGRLDRSVAGRYVAGQLMRACASSGANYQEACGAESKPDFVHKMQIVLKELRESSYWLKLATKSELISSDEVQALLAESEELTKIVAKSVVTAKGG